MNGRTKRLLGAASAVVAIGAFAASRWKGGAAAPGAQVDAGPPPARATLFVQVREPATASVVPNVLALVEQFEGRLALEAQLLAPPIDTPDEAVARCAVAQGAVRGLRFVLCRQSMGQGNDDWAPCADEAGLDKRALDACSTGPEAGTLATRGRAEAQRRGVTATPAFFVEDARAPGEPTRESLKRAACDAMSPPPAICHEPPKASGFPILVLTDARCKECRAPFWFRRMQMLFPGADIRIVDVQTASGRASYERHAPGLLPAVVLDRRVEEDPAFARVQRQLVKKDDVYFFSPDTVRPRFDPKTN